MIDALEPAPRPIPVLRATLAWVIALPLCTLPAVLWLRSYGITGDFRIIGWFGPALALLLVELWLLRPGPVRHRKTLRPLTAGGPAVMAILSAALPDSIRLWPAIGLYVGVATVLLAAYVASSRVAPDGGVPKRLAEWAGWLAPDPVAAANQPVPWIKAARTWLLIWPACLGLAAVCTWAVGGSWVSLTTALFFAYVISIDALLGSKKAPRARNDKAARAALLAGLPLYTIFICGGMLMGLPDGWVAAMVVALLTCAFALSVAITHRPSRHPAALGAMGSGDPPYPRIAPPA